MRNVVELDVSYNGLPDRFFEHLAEISPRLRNLNASYNPSMTGVSVKALIMKPGEKLKKLDLEYCSCVGVDAVELARMHGVAVKYRFPDDRLTAKK